MTAGVDRRQDATAAGGDPMQPLQAMVAGESPSVQRAVELIGQMLSATVTRTLTVDGFLHAHLGCSGADVVCETRRLTPIAYTAVGLAIAGLIDRFDPPIGPGDESCPPTWRRVEVGDKRLTPPAELSVFFEKGQLADAPVVVRLTEEFSFRESPQLMVYGAPRDRAHVESVMDAIVADSEGAMNLFRGRALKASSNNGLVIDVVDLPQIAREDVVVPDEVWREIDLNVASVTSRRDAMLRLGLGVRRGILLAGPPGVGKTVISQVIARELVGDFTVVTVDSRASRSALSGVYEEAVRFGPTVVVLEDLDLLVGDRRRGGESSALSEFLAVMDTDPDKPILTLASTNDLHTLDAAAIRSARFDAVIEIGYPSRQEATRILGRYVRDVPGGDGVAPAVVADHFGPDVSGADIREIVRRTYLAEGCVTGEGLIATVKAGRFKVDAPAGAYL